ncbi:tyrosine--tRNA ligase [Buchnera aphidicola]|uniref:tyrosine--tRNA ligase n=1 Tax=Buchnera aphidicola TaxID=9 RepID=UPI003464BC6B
MLEKNILNYFKKRKLISQITNNKKVEEILKKKKISIYCGFDPTADSLHIGHILPLLCLKKFQMQGHTPIVLIGGATSLIGDPSFKSKERSLFSYSHVLQWIEKIKKQIFLFLDFSDIPNKAIIVNNYDWFKKLNILFFLRDIGKNFSINHMINKESVKNRISREQGISFTEFSYSLLQAYDFSILYKKYKVFLQIGGSDQWGNITSGIHLTNILHKKEVFGLTIPLLKKSDGKKFGKSSSQTIWLDSKKTSPYAFYQFWINVKDSDVYNYLKYFTSLSIKEIQQIKLQDNFKKKKFKSKEILAEKMTSLVHGKSNFLSAKNNTLVFFSRNIKNLNEKIFRKLKKNNAPTLNLEHSEKNLKDILVRTKLAFSKNHARNLIASHAISINYRKETNIHYIFKSSDKLFKKYTLLSRGKKNFYLLIWK